MQGYMKEVYYFLLHNKKVWVLDNMLVVENKKGWMDFYSNRFLSYGLQFIYDHCPRK